VTGDNHVVHANLGEAYEDAGRSDDALREYAEALELFPEARQLDLRMGRLLAARGQLERASRHLMRAVRLHPEATGARFELGIVALRAGQQERAAELLAAERTLAPADARVPFHLGELAALAGDADGAREQFGTAFALDPQLPDAPVRDRDAQVSAALADALADAGRAGRAAFWARRGLVLARAAGDDALAADLAEALEGYERAAAATP
jgi:tetratricopeptide (TPR) repeat protein